MRILVDADACPVKEIIDKLLMERHIGQKVRRSGGRTKGPAKRTKEDDAHFASAFEALLSAIVQTEE